MTTPYACMLAHGGGAQGTEHAGNHLGWGAAGRPNPAALRLAAIAEMLGMPGRPAVLARAAIAAASCGLLAASAASCAACVLAGRAAAAVSAEGSAGCVRAARLGVAAGGGVTAAGEGAAGLAGGGVSCEKLFSMAPAASTICFCVGGVGAAHSPSKWLVSLVIWS